MRKPPRRPQLRVTALLGGLGAALAAGLGPAGPATAAITPSAPIEHVVILYMENHSFDEALGGLCLQDDRCDAVATGRLPDGTVIPLKPAPDVVPEVGHSTMAQKKAINGGQMNGFSTIHGCTPLTGYACYMQYQPWQIPSLAALARQYVVSDRTFALDAVPSFGAHLELVTATLDGFVGNAPGDGKLPIEGPGWGCDSFKDAEWRETPTARITRVPACVPDPSLTTVPFGGAYRASPVDHVPTVMDRLDAAGLSWKLYAGTSAGSGYSWAICPYLAGCLYTDQKNNQVRNQDILTDAQLGRLPNWSVMIPTPPKSQHNNFSMIEGDNWIARVVDAIRDGPDWDRTAIFITYDDCGCFYDHVAPPDGLGIRVPMVIVSPYARRGYTDSNVASFASLLAFTEHLFDLPPLNEVDAAAYDYGNSFDFGSPQQAGVELQRHPVPLSSRQEMLRNPADPDDPT